MTQNFVGSLFELKVQPFGTLILLEAANILFFVTFESFSKTGKSLNKSLYLVIISVFSDFNDYSKFERDK